MKKGVQSYIINSLQGGESITSGLVQRTSSACNVSPQAVYKILANLRDSETTTVSKQKTSLSLLYIEKEMERWQFAHRIAASGAELLKILNKGKTVYSFNNLRELDLFWTHCFTILSATVPNNIPRYMLTPHDFFLYARPETDSFWIEKNVTEEHISRLIVPYALPLDKEVIRERRNSSGTKFEFLVGKNPLQQKEHIYHNLLGDYIFTGSLDKEISKQIVEYIKQSVHIPRSKKELGPIQKYIETKGLFTLTIERNIGKANMMEKKLRKYFE